MKVITRKLTNSKRLMSLINTATQEGLNDVLVQVHKQAVTNAPIKTGLLKNSIVYGTYSKENVEIKGYNSYNGANRENKPAHKVREAQYISRVKNNLPQKKKDEPQGFVGTWVSRSVDENFYFTKEVDPKGNYKELDKAHTSDEGLFPYGIHVEYEVVSYLRKAIYDVLGAGAVSKTVADKIRKQIQQGAGR